MAWYLLKHKNKFTLPGKEIITRMISKPTHTHTHISSHWCSGLETESCIIMRRNYLWNSRSS